MEFCGFCKLNTDMQNVRELKYIYLGVYDYNTNTLDNVIKDIFNKVQVSEAATYICHFVLSSTYRAIIQPYVNKNYASAVVFSYATDGVIFYTKVDGSVRKYTTNWTKNMI